MSEEQPMYDECREPESSDHSLHEIAGGISDALQDMTGQTNETTVLAIDRRPQGEALWEDVTELRLRIRCVDDSEIPHAEKG
ncbi:MAG: hypothetical protein WD078_04740 [Woeseia sp.]